MSMLGAEVGGLGLETGMGARSPGRWEVSELRWRVESGERCSGEALRWLRTRALESGRLGPNPDPVSPCCVTLGKSLSFSEPQYPHLFKGRG